MVFKVNHLKLSDINFMNESFYKETYELTMIKQTAIPAWKYKPFITNIPVSKPDILKKWVGVHSLMAQCLIALVQLFGVAVNTHVDSYFNDDERLVVQHRLIIPAGIIFRKNNQRMVMPNTILAKLTFASMSAEELYKIYEENLQTRHMTREYYLLGMISEIRKRLIIGYGFFDLHNVHHCKCEFCLTKLSIEGLRIPGYAIDCSQKKLTCLVQQTRTVQGKLCDNYYCRCTNPSRQRYNSQRRPISQDIPYNIHGGYTVQPTTTRRWSLYTNQTYMREYVQNRDRLVQHFTPLNEMSPMDDRLYTNQHMKCTLKPKRFVSRYFYPPSGRKLHYINGVSRRVKRCKRNRVQTPYRGILHHELLRRCYENHRLNIGVTKQDGMPALRITTLGYVLPKKWNSIPQREKCWAWIYHLYGKMTSNRTGKLMIDNLTCHKNGYIWVYIDKFCISPLSLSFCLYL